MVKPEVQRVPCLHCTRGPKAAQSCAGGMGARSLAVGCFLGAYLPGKVPTKIKFYDSNQGKQHTVPVHQVEAESYAQAWQIVQAKQLEQWVWVKNGVPGESR